MNASVAPVSLPTAAAAGSSARPAAAKCLILEALSGFFLEEQHGGNKLRVFLFTIDGMPYLCTMSAQTALCELSRVLDESRGKGLRTLRLGHLIPPVALPSSTPSAMTFFS